MSGKLAEKDTEKKKKQIGRPSMFREKDAVAAYLKELHQASLTQLFVCDLGYLTRNVQRRFDLREHPFESVKQAVYRVARGSKIPLVRSFPSDKL